ncbi:hypothetical protein BFL35_14755 [Clavibacter michiganensis]|nr:hypothetical protein BFL35_14755 [Clavibacter michiganensis]
MPITVSTARAVDMGFRAFAASPGCAARPASAAAARSRFRSTRVPARPSTAGVSVMATSTATSTHTAPTVPISARNGTPVMLRARSATITVDPANTTAVPEVPVASPIDSRTPVPASICFRCRLTMKRE